VKSNKDDQSKGSSDFEQPVEESDRREFLKKAGKFAVYTTPAIVALMHYDKTTSAADLPPVSQ
jgi:hypothetical protein